MQRLNISRNQLFLEIEKSALMQIMKLTGMNLAFRSIMETGFNNELTADELIAYLIDTEWEERHNRIHTRLIKNANFRYQASVEQIDTCPKRNLDKNQLLRLSDCSWIHPCSPQVFLYRLKRD